MLTTTSSELARPTFARTSRAKVWTRRVARLSLAGLVTASVGAFSQPAQAERVRDLCEVAGARENQLLGYGIVTGLAGTGDNIQVPLSQQSLQSLMIRLGIRIDAKQLQLKNVAAVMVTATMPAFAKNGTKLDITVSSTGNAKSLVGGTLLQTLLKGADQKVYAIAQGNLLVGGFEAKGGSGSSVKVGVPTSGRIPEGALVEHEIAANFVEKGTMKLELRTPAFGMAARIAEAVDKKFGGGTAQAPDSGSVLVKVPSAYNGRTVELVAALEELDITPIRRARVVINEKTGTIVASGDVRLQPVAVMHGSLTIVVKETPMVSQPTPGLLGGGAGSTVVVPRSDIEAKETTRSLTYMPIAPSLSDVASALGALGLSPRELGSVLQALRTAGSLEAEVVIQ